MYRLRAWILVLSIWAAFSILRFLARRFHHRTIGKAAIWILTHDSL